MFFIHLSDTKERELVKLFWTGGWDSTFRLLQLVLEQGRTVQPYYVIDPNRLSLRHEIKAMSDIEQAIYQRSPDKKGLILPTIIVEAADIPLDEEIESARKVFITRKRMETQFLWFVRYCKQHQIYEMELCNETKLNPSPGYVKHYYLTQVGDGPEHRLADEYRTRNENILFQYFNYPIFGMTKLDMKNYADKAGWSDLMAMTWFCHYPVKGRYPCGTCMPCNLVIREGLGWRIPWHRRIYARLGVEKMRKKLAELIRKANPGFHQWKQ